jgi:antitoxin YefM
MHAMSYTAARQNLAKTMENVCDDHEPVIITSKRDRAVVMISLEDYNSLEETAYLLRSPKNAKRLHDAKMSIEAGLGVERELIECD